MRVRAFIVDVAATAIYGVVKCRRLVVPERLMGSDVGVGTTARECQGGHQPDSTAAKPDCREPERR